MFMLVVGGWYKKQEQALRMGAWYCWTGYVSAISPLINYGLGHIKGGGCVLKILTNPTLTDDVLHLD